MSFSTTCWTALSVIMSDRQSSLGEFDDGDTLAREVERNAADIEHLIDIVGSVTEQIEHLTEHSTPDVDGDAGVDDGAPAVSGTEPIRGFQ